VDTEIEEAYSTPCRKEPLDVLLAIVKMPRSQTKERILKAAKEKCLLTYKGKLIRITSNLPPETIKARNTLNYVFQALRVNNCHPRILYPAKLIFKIN
jgi:hypothetical protein